MKINDIIQEWDRQTPRTTSVIDYRDPDERFLIMSSRGAYIAKGLGEYRKEIPPRAFSDLDSAIKWAEQSVTAADQRL